MAKVINTVSNVTILRKFPTCESYEGQGYSEGKEQTDSPRKVIIEQLNKAGTQQNKTENRKMINVFSEQIKKNEENIYYPKVTTIKTFFFCLFLLHEITKFDDDDDEDDDVRFPNSSYVGDVSTR